MPWRRDAPSLGSRYDRAIRGRSGRFALRSLRDDRGGDSSFEIRDPLIKRTGQVN